MYAKPECLMESLDKRREALRVAKAAVEEQVAGADAQTASTRRVKKLEEQL